MLRLFILILTLSFTFSALARRSDAPKSGVWKFELKYPNTEVPFLMELEPGRHGWSAVLVNGKERIDIEKIIVSKGKWILPLQTYQNYLEFTSLSPNLIRGYFVKPNKSPEERIPLVGTHGNIRRFKLPANKPKIDLSGKWSMEMIEEDGTKSQAVLLFDQSGNSLHASIMTVTGDYRYINGVVADDSFEAATFDGVYNFLFTGKLEGSTLSGVIAGKSTTKFTATRNDKATLPDPLSQTQVETLDFTFPDLDGKKVSLKDFTGKPVIVQIFGSWCPNCIDELGFLGPWYKQNKNRGVEIIALSFERALSEKEALSHLKMVAKKRAIPYTVLLAGSSSADKPAEKLPGMKNFISFPTTIFLDKNHKVMKVHAGFNGPGTGLYYDEFKKMFEKTIDELTK
ncbi:MAG: TlpA family protein disulfide reductase [Bacteriovoracaceae bacterium]|nr:TlpA family protein disulfide reductase [Bacteriovoracaceae bacterium]